MSKTFTIPILILGVATISCGGKLNLPEDESEDTISVECTKIDDHLECDFPDNVKGEKGDRGEPGTPGEKGDSGDRGEQGAPGEKGDKGDRGETGAPGEKGDNGDRGEQGIPGRRGIQGMRGEQGLQGERGEQGLQGEQGEQGLQGERGEQGLQGERGEQGLQGEQGEQGLQGEQGNDGTSCVITQIPEGALIECGDTHAVIEHGDCSCESICKNIDFDFDANGNMIYAGQLIDSEYSAWGVQISAINNRNKCYYYPDKAITFDSENPTGGDWDLETTNERNVLIIAENDIDEDNDGFVDDPDDERYGGILSFSFDFPVRITTLGLLDTEANDNVVDVTTTQGVITLPLEITGDGGQTVMDIYIDNVILVEVRFSESAAISSLGFCSDNN